MLFNSLGYIFVFLPIVLGIYLLLKRDSASFTSKLWLVLASLFFYGSGAISFLLLFLLSVFWNYFIGHTLLQRKAKSILALGIAVDVLALVYFKYSGFLIHNYNLLTHGDVAFVNHLFPLAISFFTFQQIAYLVDCHQNKCPASSLIDYTLFVSFFPQLIAGPIVHYQEMMPQFAGAKSGPNIDNICKGIFLFSLGLFKKVAIADVFSSWVGPGFGTLTAPSFFDAWAVSLSYTFQIYFDFSGYTDMALGAGLLFNIHLPITFDSPYKSLSIQEFWRRWHITLSRWLRDYLYIPFGGNRHGQARTLANLLLTFIIGRFRNDIYGAVY